MGKRRCLGWPGEPCRAFVADGQSRCGSCVRLGKRRRGTPAHYSGSWRRDAERRVAAHRAELGDWCPGYRRAPHVASDLTVDHGPDGLVAGVLCRSCNSSKGAREPVFTQEVRRGAARSGSEGRPAAQERPDGDEPRGGAAAGCAGSR